MEPSKHFLALFIEHLRIELALSENTISSYKSQLAGFLDFLDDENKDLLEADSNTVRGYLVFKRDKGCSSSTRFITTVAIKKFYNFLKQQKVIKDDPSIVIQLPKCRQRIPAPLSTNEIETLIERATGFRFSMVRMKAMLEILYSTGMRVSELLNLRLSDVDFSNKWIRVLGKGNKSRDVPFGEKAEAALGLYLSVREARSSNSTSPNLFWNTRGGKLSRGGFWKQLRVLGKLACIGGTVFPHRLRHTTACHLLANGIDIRILQELLGHSSIVTTQRYTRVMPEVLKSRVKSLHPHF